VAAVVKRLPRVGRADQRKVGARKHIYSIWRKMTCKGVSSADLRRERRACPGSGRRGFVTPRWESSTPFGTT
jgi:hypothetical protein